MYIGRRIPVGQAEPTELDGLLWGKVNDNEAVDSRGLAVFGEPLVSVAENGVVVAHEEHGDLETAGAGISYNGES